MNSAEVSEDQGESDDLGMRSTAVPMDSWGSADLWMRCTEVLVDFSESDDLWMCSAGRRSVRSRRGIEFIRHV